MFSHWMNLDYLPRWGVLLIDLFIVFVAFVISYVIGNNLLVYNIDNLVLDAWQQVLILLVIQTVFFWAFHTYSGILRYSTFVDTIKVSLAVIATGVVMIVANIITQNTLQKDSIPEFSISHLCLCGYHFAFWMASSNQNYF